MAEVLMRRFHNAWRRPDVLLMDGGLPQVHAAEAVIQSLGLTIPIVGIAKGAERKRNDLIFSTFANQDFREMCVNHQRLLEQVRDEAHRFAITYHKKLRRKFFLP
jgi:excinuclease ABC subunit C